MKEEKKSGELEPTISDVMGKRFDSLEGAIQDLSEAMQMGFERHEKILDTLVAGQENLTERVNGIDQRLTTTQSRVEDVAEMLEDMTEVVDENRDVLFKHEGRISVLEKATA
ncbi:MAG: hypothetical protein WA053_02015 [Minisyncoccia bacterium]